tara:strand:+ start:2029 stop:2358 length:330 start_codon:yes stop_codon:yes gene_type:complete
MNQLEFIEHSLKQILLKNIVVELRGRSVITGKLVFYEFKDFNFKLIFDNSKKLEFPYPFHITADKEQICLSYHNKFVHHNDPIYKFKMINSMKNLKNKFYNSTLSIIIK